MYQFNYQNELQYDEPFIASIVPTGWLVLDLPTLGGAVIYEDKLKQAEKPTDFVFEFAEIQSEFFTRHHHLNQCTRKTWLCD